MPLNKTNIKKLIKALKSPKYTKIRGKLRNADGYDVLGLACEVYRLTSGAGKWVKVSSSKDGEQSFGDDNPGLAAVLPKEVVKFYGFKDDCPGIKYKGKETLLVDLNDYYKLPFTKIAEVLENNL